MGHRHGRSICAGSLNGVHCNSLSPAAYMNASRWCRQHTPAALAAQVVKHSCTLQGGVACTRLQHLLRRSSSIHARCRWRERLAGSKQADMVRVSCILQTAPKVGRGQGREGSHLGTRCTAPDPDRHMRYRSLHASSARQQCDTVTNSVLTSRSCWHDQISKGTADRLCDLILYQHGQATGGVCGTAHTDRCIIHTRCRLLMARPTVRTALLSSNVLPPSATIVPPAPPRV